MRGPEPRSSGAEMSDEELLALLLGRELSPEDTWVRARLDADPGLRNRLHELGAVTALLDRDAQVEGQVLQEIVPPRPEPAEASSRKSWPWLALAAAALFLTLQLMRSDPPTPGGSGWSPGSGEHLGSNGIECLSPGPEVDAWAAFEIRFKEAGSLQFLRWEIYSAAASGEPEALLSHLRRFPDEASVHRWQPSKSELALLPASIVWEVSARGLDGLEYFARFESRRR